MWHVTRCDRVTIAWHLMIASLHTSDQWQWHNVITDSVLHNNRGQTTPRAEDFYTMIRNSPTRSEAPTASNSHVFIQVVRVRWFITIANNANIYPRLPGRWLVCWCWPLWACLTARMTDCFLPPSSKQRREKLLFVQSLAGFLDRYSN